MIQNVKQLAKYMVPSFLSEGEAIKDGKKSLDVLVVAHIQLIITALPSGICMSAFCLAVSTDLPKD